MENTKKTRNRDKPQKKWTLVEQNQILEYMLENIDIEKPTARIYYNNMIENIKLEATHEMLRSKVRYWKTSFLKAEEWRKSTGTVLDDYDDCTTIKEKLYQMCPLYDKLFQIFNTKSNADMMVESSTFIISEISNSSNISSNAEHEEVLVEVDVKTCENPLSPGIHETTPQEPESGRAYGKKWETQMPKKSFHMKTENPLSPGIHETTSPEPECGREYGKKWKTQMPKYSFHEPDELQKKRYVFFEERISIEKKKLALEREKLDFEMEISKASLEIENRKIEVELKKIQNKFELKKLELEQKEKLGLMELKLKYAKD